MSVWALAFPLLLAMAPQGPPAQGAAPPPFQKNKAGSLQLSLSSRIFSAPLFGPQSTGVYHVLGSQSLADRGNLAFWFSSGFPNFSSDLGVQWSDIPVLSGVGTLEGGDLLLKPLRPVKFGSSLRETYALRGAAFRQQSADSQWNVFAGQARRFRQLPGRDDPPPILFGGGYLKRRGFDHYGISVVSAARPIYVDNPASAAPIATVVSGDFVRELSPWTSFFTQVSTSDRGGFGARAGAQWGNQIAEMRATFYSFSNRFPFLDPLFRPGETGVEFWGRYDLTGSASVFGFLDYVADSQVDETSQWRSEVAFNWNLGGRLPQLRASYSRNETTFNTLSIAEPGTVVDRISLSFFKPYTYGFYALSAEHLANSEGAGPDRSQLTFDFRRTLGHRESFIEGSTVAQWEAGSRFGFTSEAFLERSLWSRYSFRVGGGLAILDATEQTRGEGVARFGFARRIRESGWSARIEVVKPFPIGLPRADLAQNGLVVELGYRFGWNDRRPLPGFSGSRAGGTGTIVGRISSTVIDPGGIPILLNGRRVVRSTGQGEFRIKKAPAGTMVVSPDLRGLDPRFGIVGGPSRTVEVVADQTVAVEFEIRSMSYLQGALVVCVGQGVRPVLGVSLLLEGDEYRRTVITSRVGGFQFASIPPGPYRLILMDDSFDWPPSVQLPLIWKLDLTDDLPGHIIRVNCGDTGEPGQDPPAGAGDRLQNPRDGSQNAGDGSEVGSGRSRVANGRSRVASRRWKVENGRILTERLVESVLNSSPVVARSSSPLVSIHRTLDFGPSGLIRKGIQALAGARPELPDGAHPPADHDQPRVENVEGSVDDDAPSRLSRGRSRVLGSPAFTDWLGDRASAVDPMSVSSGRLPQRHPRHRPWKTVAPGITGAPEWNRIRRFLWPSSRGPPQRSSRDPPTERRGVIGSPWGPEAQ